MGKMRLKTLFQRSIPLLLLLAITTTTLLTAWSRRAQEWANIYSRKQAFNHANIKFSANEIYTRHYGETSLDVIQKTLRDRLCEVVNHPPSGTFPPNSVRISGGTTVEVHIVSTHGYVHTSDSINPLCFDKTDGLHPVCMSALPHGFVTASGRAITPADETVFEISGGCCSHEWPHPINTTVQLSQQSRKSYQRYRKRVIVVLSQHHGTTYHHVIHEIVTRYLIVLPILDAFPDALVCISKSDIAVTLLTMLGLDRSRILQMKNDGMNWIGAALLLFPQTVYGHEDELPFGRKQTIITADILRRITLNQFPLASPASKARRPLLLLMERATNRKKDGTCNHSRCMKNFDEFRKALAERLDMDIVVFGAAEDFKTTLQLFGAADVVVGIHGAGFQNVMFCNSGTTVVHIGFAAHYKPLGDQFSLKFHPVIIEGITLLTKNIVLDVPDIVRRVAEAVDTDRVYERVASAI